MPPRSQQRGLPPSIEQVGDLVGSEHMTEEHPVQSTFPLEQIQPLELEEEDEDDVVGTQVKLVSQLEPAPPSSQHNAIPPMEQVGDLLESVQPIISPLLHPGIHVRAPLKQTHPLELEEEDEVGPPDELEVLPEEDEVVLVEEQITKPGSQIPPPEVIQQSGEPLVQTASNPGVEQVCVWLPGQHPPHIKSLSQLNPEPPASQQRGVPPSIEQVGDLVESEHITDVHPVQIIFPPEHMQPLELEEDDEDELEEDEVGPPDEDEVGPPDEDEVGPPEEDEVGPPEEDVLLELQIKFVSQFEPVPPASQHSAIPPIEQVGDLLESVQPIVPPLVHPGIHVRAPLKQTHPLEEEDEDEELDVDEQIAKEESHVDVPGIQQSGDPLVQTGSVPGREQV